MAIRRFAPAATVAGLAMLMLAACQSGEPAPGERQLRGQPLVSADFRPREIAQARVAGTGQRQSRRPDCE